MNELAYYVILLSFSTIILLAGNIFNLNQIQMQQQLRTTIEQVFPQFDKNGSGTLDCKELGGFFNEVFRRLGYKITVTDAQAEESVKYIDKNSDNQVNQAEVFLVLKDIVSKRKPSNPQPEPQPPSQPHQNPQPYGPSSWDQPPQQPWGQPQPQNNWGQPQNNWGQPQQPQQYGGWGQPPQNPYGQQQPGWGGQQQPGWGGQPQQLRNEWGNTQFVTQADHALKREIDNIYAKYDQNRSGSLDGREIVGAFNEVLRSLGSDITVNQSQADNLLQAVDSSSDGAIQKPEFYKMLKYLMDSPDDY